MPFTAGASGNLNGRPKGSKSKHVKPLRTLLTNFAEDKFPEIVEEFEKLEPKEKLKFYIDILALAPNIKLSEIVERSFAA